MAVFFNPSPKFKEYIILDLIEHDENITQRKLSEKVNSSVSMINLYLDNYEKDKLWTSLYYVDSGFKCLFLQA